MIDLLLIVALLAYVAWRASCAEATAPGDPALALIAAALVVARYVYRRAARWDAEHEGAQQ